MVRLRTSFHVAEPAKSTWSISTGMLLFSCPTSNLRPSRVLFAQEDGNADVKSLY